MSPKLPLARALALLLVVVLTAGCRKDLPTDTRPPFARPETSACEDPAPLIVPSSGSRVEDRYLVVYDDTVSSPDARTDALEARLGIEATFRYRSVIKGFAATLPPATLGVVRCEAYVQYVQQETGS